MTTSYYISSFLIPASSYPVVNLQWENSTNSTVELLISDAFSDDITALLITGNEITIQIITEDFTIYITGDIYQIVNRESSSKVSLENIVITGTEQPTGIVIGPTTSSIGNVVIFNNETGNLVADSGIDVTTLINNSVTNGDLHDHNGGDGAQIDHTTLSNIGVNSHTTIDGHISNTSNPHSTTASQVGAISHSLATATNDFLIASGSGTFIKKTLAETKTVLGLGSAAYTSSSDYAVSAKGVTNGDSHDHNGGDGGQIDHGGLSGLLDDDHTQYIKHILATAANDFLVASESGTFVKKTLAETKTVLGLGSAAYTSSTDYAVSAKGVTNGDSHDHSGGDGASIPTTSVNFSATAKVLGRKTAGSGAGEECSVSELIDLLGTAERGDVLYRGTSSWTLLPHGTSGQVLQSGGHGADPSWTTVSSSSTSFWTTFPDTITRVSDTSFSIPDASNANLYDKMFDPGTIVKWEKSGGGAQFAMITAASYATNTVTYTILGNTLSAGFSLMKYCIHKAIQDINILPGTCPLAAETTVGKTILIPYDIYVFGARIRYGTAATTTGGTWDINDDATSIFTTKPTISAGSTSGSWQVADCLLNTALTEVVADSLITTDYDSGHATTPGADAYIRILFMPVSWRYRA